MIVQTYKSSGGKDYIIEYIKKLPNNERSEAYYIIEHLKSDGIDYLESHITRQIDRKLWEIKFWRHNRFFYILIDHSEMHIVHVCKKQKPKAEKKDIDLATQRMKEVYHDDR